VANQDITELDPRGKTLRLESGESVAYDLFVGIPVHRVPEVVESSGLAVDGWIPVDRANLATRFADVYAVGDVAGAPTAKAGVFAESAAGSSPTTSPLDSPAVTRRGRGTVQGAAT
jgi:sulfide:quinone oxidoreductase